MFVCPIIILEPLDRFASKPRAGSWLGVKIRVGRGNTPGKAGLPS